MTGRCVLLGDVMMDISAILDADIAYASDTPAHIALLPGGVAANTSAWMAMTGEQVSLVGAVGPDAFGRSIRERLRGIGVDVHLSEGSRPTGACVVIVDRRRERTMFPDAGANSEVDTDVVLSLVREGDHLHLSGYTLANPGTRDVALQALAHARAVGASTSLDPASAAPIRMHRPVFDHVISHVDVLLANEMEAAALTDLDHPHAALDELADRAPSVVVKLGARGAIAREAGTTVEEPSHAGVILDTTGAGDAFTAGFLPPWKRGEGLSAAMARGEEVAAMAVARVGASPLDP